MTSAKNQDQRYWHCWTRCRRYDQPADDICLSIHGQRKQKYSHIY